MRCRSLVGFFTAVFVCGQLPTMAHDGHTQSSNDNQHSHSHGPTHQRNVKAVNTQPKYMLVSFLLENKELKTENSTSGIARHFEKFKDIKTRSDGKTLFIESSGLPSHDMMVGIRSWQQQVPLPHPFTGKNAWQIPLKPKLAAKPISAKNYAVDEAADENAGLMLIKAQQWNYDAIGLDLMLPEVDE